MLDGNFEPYYPLHTHMSIADALMDISDDLMPIAYMHPDSDTTPVVANAGAIADAVRDHIRQLITAIEEGDEIIMAWKVESPTPVQFDGSEI